MDDFLQDGYRYHRKLPELLDGLMRALAVRSGLREGMLQLAGVGVLTLEQRGGELTSAWALSVQHAGPVTEEAADKARILSVDDAVRAAEMHGASIHEMGKARSSAAAVDSIRLPISYADTQLGEIHLEWERSPDSGELELCRGFAKRCGLLAKRYELQHWAEQRLGRSLLLVGRSTQLEELELFVERAIRSGLPVLLAGEFGTEKALLAASIHSGSSRRDGPFVEVNCAEPSAAPAQWFELARGGTLFLSGIDELAPHLQNQIPPHMRSHLGQWLGAAPPSDVRLIAATTANLSERVRSGLFSKSLFVELDFLAATIPPLRERLADIEPLVASILDRHGYQVEHKRTDALIAACAAHAWPENLFELERVIARLAVMTDGRPIGHLDILRHAPWVSLPNEAPLAGEIGEVAIDDNHDDESELAVPEHWVRCAITRDMAELGKLHESVKKALLYLGEHYAEPISLGQLAQQAHVSPSHLTFLFRSELGTAFKPFLLRIRVHKAREILLADARMRITEVALSVGFTDLSHFEKSFRRIVGQSPREFRRGRDEASS